MGAKLYLILGLGCVSLATALAASAKLAVDKEAEVAKRLDKHISIFNVVQFPNSPCTSTSTRGNASPRNGTCFTSTECSNQGGTSSGTCASGFGVCCLFTLSTSGSTISQNCSYIQNPGFPTALAGGSAVSYTVNKCNDAVCWLRLDFDTFSLLGTGDTTESNGGVCQDTFTVTAISGNAYPTICGENAGQHIYVDLGATASDSATINFNFLGTDTTTGRQWEIKVTQVECGNQAAPPDCCLQYHTGLTGRISTFNFAATGDNHLADQRYSACIRQECGFCCVQYTPCADSGTDAFSIDTNLAIAQGRIDSVCSLDYIGIPGSSGECNQNTPLAMTFSRFCGGFFTTSVAGVASSTVCDCTPPFSVDVFTDTAADDATAVGPNVNQQSRGACLEYTQIPC